MKALLLDLQGVLIEDGAPLPGAVEAVGKARAEGRILRFVTNTATRHPLQILRDLQGMPGSVFATQDRSSAVPKAYANKPGDQAIDGWDLSPWNQSGISGFHFPFQCEMTGEMPPSGLYR